MAPRWNGRRFVWPEEPFRPKAGPALCVRWALTIATDHRGSASDRLALVEFHLREALRLMDLLERSGRVPV